MFGHDVRAEGPEAGGGWDGPVTAVEGFDARADRDDLEAALVAGDGGGLWGAEERGELRLDAVGALDSVHVGGVDGHGEGAQEDGAVGKGGRDGVSMQVQDVGWLAELGEDQRLGLCVTIGAGEVAAGGEGAERPGQGRRVPGDRHGRGRSRSGDGAKKPATAASQIEGSPGGHGQHD